MSPTFDAPGKPLLASLTFWGAVLTLAALLAPHLGLELVDPQGLAQDLAAAVGAVLSVLGRLRATRRITTLARPPRGLADG
jgi:hypothetical protein